MAHTKNRTYAGVISVMLIMALISGCGKKSEGSFADQVSQMADQAGAGNEAGQAQDEAGSITDKINDMAEDA